MIRSHFKQLLTVSATCASGWRPRCSCAALAHATRSVLLRRRLVARTLTPAGTFLARCAPGPTTSCHANMHSVLCSVAQVTDNRSIRFSTQTAGLLLQKFNDVEAVFIILAMILRSLFIGIPMVMLLLGGLLALFRGTS